MTPLDLARWRALASELIADARSGHLGILYSQGEGAIARAATALRAACDEVERLRAEVASWQRYKAQLDEAFNSGDGNYRP